MSAVAPKEFVDHADYLRQLDAAIEKQNFDRDAAFLFLTRSVGDYECAPLTLEKYNTLRIWNSPFLPPFRTPRPHDIWQFLWLLSPDYVPGQNKAQQDFYKGLRKIYSPPTRPARWKLRFKFFRSAYKARRRLCLWRSAIITKQIRDFVDGFLQDRPPKVENPYVPEPDFYSDACSLCAALAREFGGGIGAQQIREIMRLPLDVLFQFLQERKHYVAAQIPDARNKPLLFNPSDKVADRYLKQLNAASAPHKN